MGEMPELSRCVHFYIGHRRPVYKNVNVGSLQTPEKVFKFEGQPGYWSSIADVKKKGHGSSKWIARTQKTTPSPGAE